MQIKSSNKFIDLYLFTIGFTIIFILIAFHMHKFRWVALIPGFGIILWLVVLKHRFATSIVITDNTLTVKYFQTFRKKHESFPISNCQFNLYMHTRLSRKNPSKKTYRYELTISTENIVRWKFYTDEGFRVEDFQALLQKTTPSQ